MREHDLFSELNKEDSELQIPASLQPENSGALYKKGLRKKRRKISVGASVICLCLVAAIVAVVPVRSGVQTRMPDMENNMLQDYEAVYQLLSSVQKQGETKKTWRESWFGSKGNQFIEENDMAAPNTNAGNDTAAPGTGTQTDYSETNLQTAGVDEGDIVKTDGEYVYILQSMLEGSRVQIVKVLDGTLERQSVIQVPAFGDQAYQTVWELYISGNFLVVMSTANPHHTGKVWRYSGVNSEIYEKTVLYIYDISNRQNPALLHTQSQDGGYVSSRVADGYLYTVSVKRTYDIKFDTPNTYIPEAGGALIACEDLVFPAEPNQTDFTVVTALKISDAAAFTDSKGFLYAPDDLYVSAGAMYLSSAVASKTGTDTELIKVAYQDGTLSRQASGTVEGYLHDQFSMDEKDGYLRLVTTENKVGTNGVIMDDVESWPGMSQENHLFVLDGSLRIVGELRGLAPDESIYSARFIGDMAYFVTFRQVDPLFSVDLSDPANPVLMGALKIPGFSSYLHPYSETLLLGIGMDADEQGRQLNAKLSMFDISDPADVREVHKYILPEEYEFEAMRNHKAVLAAPGLDLIGFQGGYDYDAEDGRYLASSSYYLIGYREDSGFYLKTRFSLEDVDPDYDSYAYRGIYIGTQFVVAGPGHIALYDMEQDYRLLMELDLLA